MSNSKVLIKQDKEVPKRMTTSLTSCQEKPTNGQCCYKGACINLACSSVIVHSCLVPVTASMRAKIPWFQLFGRRMLSQSMQIALHYAIKPSQGGGLESAKKLSKRTHGEHNRSGSLATTACTSVCC